MKLKIQSATANHLISVINLGLTQKGLEKIDRAVMHENLIPINTRIRGFWNRKSKTINISATQLLCIIKSMNSAQEHLYAQSSVYVCKHYVIDPLLKQLDEL